jgi:hypothetical protein
MTQHECIIHILMVIKPVGIPKLPLESDETPVFIRGNPLK